MTYPWLTTACARWAPSSSEALVLRGWLAGPMAWDAYSGITIEGALQWVVGCREANEVVSDALIGSGFVDIRIPIEDITIAGCQVACASWARLPTGYIEDTRFRRKRTRVEALGMAQVMTNGGPFKAMQIPVSCVVAPYVDFSVRGDRCKLVDLLRDVAGIGRDRGRGLGIVEGWEVISDETDGSVIVAGAPRRTIPIEYGDISMFADGTFEVRDAVTYRAPYWHPATRRMCVVPS